MSKGKLEQEKMAVAKINKNLADRVFDNLALREEQGRLHIPNNYSISNALVSFWFKAQNAVGFEKATKESIAEAMMETVIMGLSPAKDQVYPIVYGNKMTTFVSYFGRIALVDRLKGTERSPRAVIIHEGDTLDVVIEGGMLRVENHKTSWENFKDGKIVGAYASMRYKGQEEYEIMTMEKIQEAWGGAKGRTNADKPKFTEEFVKRTVLNRLTKRIVKTSSDEDVELTDRIASLDDEHYDFSKGTAKQVEFEVEEEVKLNANTGEVVDVEEEPEIVEVDEDVGGAPF